MSLEVAIRQHQTPILLMTLLKLRGKTRVSLKHLELAFNLLHSSVWDTVHEHFGCCKFAEDECRNNCPMNKSMTEWSPQ
jgi:hypothetical protein